MSNFTLSKKNEKILPTSLLSTTGSIFSINADYRNILRIFRMMVDPNINDRHKPFFILKWFFLDEIPADGLNLFEEFLSTGEQKERTSEKQKFCFEFDAEEIFASFLMVYGIDLLDVDFLHWYKFSALLSGLFMCENPLSKKIEIRTLDVSKCENKSAARKAKESVQIPERVGYSDLAIREKVIQALKNGDSVTNLLEGGGG